jgi:hypothetical protein
VCTTCPTENQKGQASLFAPTAIAIDKDVPPPYVIPAGTPNIRTRLAEGRLTVESQMLHGLA